MFLHVSVTSKNSEIIAEMNHIFFSNEIQSSGNGRQIVTYPHRSLFNPPYLINNTVHSRHVIDFHHDRSSVFAPPFISLFSQDGNVHRSRCKAMKQS